MKQSSKKIVICIALILSGIIMAWLLSKDKVLHEYSFEGVELDALDNSINDDECILLLNYDSVYENVEIDFQSGHYKPINDDPWIMFSGINNKYSGLILKLKEKVSEPNEVKLYFTKLGDEALSERLTKVDYINKGEDSLFISLPDYPLNIIRLDISKECDIEQIVLANKKVIDKKGYEGTFWLSFIIKLVIILPILFLAYLYHCNRVRTGGHPIAGLLVDPENTGRLYEYDYIRTLAALLVIMMHSVIETYAPVVGIGEPGYFTLKIILAISLVCNVLYIMLSGALLLKPKKESIGDFYKKRLGKVLIPTLSYYLLYMLQGYPNEVFQDGIVNGLLIIGKGLLTSRPEYMLHMWFIYAILGLYIFAPFLRIIVENITDKQLFGLILAGFIFDIFSSFLPMAGINFGIDTPIASWMGVFLLGYYMTTEHARKNNNLYIILGIFGFIGTCLLVYYHPEFLFYESNWAPLMWLEGMGIFAFFIRFNKIFGKRNVIISSISKYNFSIMLIHVLLLMKIILPIGWQLEAQYGHLRLYIFGMIAVCFVMSYIVSVIYDNTAIAAANYIYSLLINKKEPDKR